MLDACLAAVAGVAPIVVVDNSSDLEVAAVVQRHGAQYVDAGANLGFAAGVNLGVRTLGPGTDLLLLNPDAILTAEGARALHARLTELGGEYVAALSPRLVGPDSGEEQRVRWPLPAPARMWREAVGLSRLAPPPDEFCVGAVLLLNAQAIAEVGPFDERFFLYAEETDWQRRAVMAGWRTAEMPDVIAVHQGAGTSTDLSRREVLFHAGTETYVRKWFGRRGWLSYRAAAILGAGLRGMLLRGQEAAVARARASLYLRGPRSVADLPPRPTHVGRRVVHVVVTDAFAGVERYVAEVAREQADRGAIVTVVGGNAARMASELRRVRHLPAADVKTAVRQLARLGRQDIVHTHMTAADFAAVAAAPWHHAAIVSTRHFAGPRGSHVAARLTGRLARTRIDQQIAISRFVARALREPAMVIPNGVRTQPEHSGPRDRVVLCLQRLENEKATDVGLRAWAASDVAKGRWQLHLAGSGALRPQLESLAKSLGIQDSVVFLGHVDDTASHLRRAGLLMATAPAEPFGLSVAEAMAHGTPILAADGGAHPELLGEDGWLFPAGDVRAAADELHKVLTMPEEERAAMGRRLRQRQQNYFDLITHVTDIQNIYAKVTTHADTYS
jgi:glycosyltransferase involved in cell wall biosynthesis/GT2 family glycosyltransferase